ncbi:MAG: phosphoenolpyruvate synthase [Candidatus Altiarchaeales archaeon]|nr:MAG: phosphoenolpyruvate synthase [Candidatus Altiarchaeales archaeon]HDO81883.1 phosphoenolpyruvate synthase [Candidatus Altiarchaeales archaeon]HEX54532.1 phosphoenolpyruvate synthase [Candidatus Altiarchaeales archaeon]
MVGKSERFILWFDEIGIEDIPLVGGKNASLGEMIRELSEKGINVPNGFAITSYAYRYFIKNANIEDKIREILSDLDTHNIRNLMERGRKIRELIENSELPRELEDAIINAYNEMGKRFGYGENPDVAVRSSATAEDLPDASFAGQQETFLNVRGAENVIKACKKCFASLFTDRAISYRVDKGFDHFNVYLSIGIQKMVRSDSASSGVAFSIDTESGFKDVVFITGSYGLGENIVQGKVNPDEFYVFKPTLKKGKRPIIGKKLGTKRIKMIYSECGNGTKNVETTEEERNKFCLSDDEILKLAEWVTIIEDHYSKREGRFKPMDVEWAKDGDGKNVGTGKLFIVQARPETVHSIRDKLVMRNYVLKERGRVLLEGQAVGDMIGQGEVNVIENAKDIRKFKKGQVLVTDMTDPDWEPIMKMAAAIVTNRGGRTCHAAIVSRELGIPCVIGTEKGTKILKTGQKVTVSCADGEIGYIYDGLLKFEIEEINLDELPKTKTKIMMNVGIPEKAFFDGQIPNDGVGLAREEFIINSYIGIHPLALINYEKLKKRAKNNKKIAEVVEQIDKRTSAYKDKTQFFIDELARGIGRIAAAFYPNDVIVRFSDFKTNEYADLIGGFLYEPQESNPMIGWRGASRYYDENFKPAFGLECKAILKARNEFGLTNIKVMVPFCRTPEEGKKVIETMKEFGLVQGENGLEVYVMCEIPSNVILADKFAEIFDGFSIGSNDLTQLVLGLDRDSELVSHIYDERNDAVKKMIANVIKIARERGKKIGICGQAPSDYEDFAEFLVECGIDSISLNPDTVIKTRLRIAEKERQLGISNE